MFSIKWATAALLWSSAVAMIHHLTIEQDERQIFPIELFGFYKGGVINITVRDFSISSAGEAMKIGVFIREVDSQSSAQTLIEESKATGKCLLNHKENLATVDLHDQKNWKRSSLYHIVQSGDQGLYLVAFARCKPTGASTTVNFKMDAIFLNPGPNYLSAGETALPNLYAAITVVFLLATVVWVRHCLANPTKVHKIHHMMTILLVLKMLSVLFESVRYHYIKLTGYALGWNAVYYFFTFLKSMMLFVVILLIGTGWSLLKPYLTGRQG
jgi:hypothetical protein